MSLHSQHWPPPSEGWLALSLALLGFGAGLPSVARAAPPTYDHVVIVVEENTGYNAVIDRETTTLNSWMAGGVSLTKMRGITHPSGPNYLALFSGDNQGITSDNAPVAGSLLTPNLGSALAAAGRTFLGYADGLPSAGDTTVESYPYVRYHCPWLWWVSSAVPRPANQLPPTVHQPFRAFPSDFTQLPTVAMVIPSNSHNMHDGSPGDADSWLRQNLQAYATWAQTHNSLLIVTWDEDAFRQTNLTPAIFYGANLNVGQNAGTWSVHNVLRTIEDMYGLAHSGLAASVPPIYGIFAGESPVITRSFTNYVNGYTGCVSNVLKSSAPAQSFGGIGSLPVAGNGSAASSEALLRFDNVFGTQVPSTLPIRSAKVYLTTEDFTYPAATSTAKMNMHRMLVPWSGTSTWNSMTGGVSLNGIEAVSTPEFWAVPNYADTVAGFDVTASAAAWQGGAANCGWTIQTTSTDDWESRSANNGNYGPLLEVTYAPTNPSLIGFQPAFLRANPNGNAVATVTRTGSAGAVSAVWATTDGTARTSSDYTSSGGTLNWGDGDVTPREVTIPIKANTASEADEYFYIYIVSTTGAATIVSTGLAMVTISGGPYYDWADQQFGVYVYYSNGTQLGDFDKDGLTNLAEYALGLSPTAYSKPPEASVFTYPEGDRLRMFVPRDPAHNDITVNVEASGDLVAWTALATSTLGAPFTGPGYIGGDDATLGVKTVEVRDIVNLSSATQRWLRVKVTH